MPARKRLWGYEFTMIKKKGFQRVQGLNFKHYSISSPFFNSHDFSSNLYYNPATWPITETKTRFETYLFFPFEYNSSSSFVPPNYFHLKIVDPFKDCSQSSQRFARVFSLWCGRGIEPSARGRGETKIIDLIEGADKRPFTSLWITLRVSICVHIYIDRSVWYVWTSKRMDGGWLESLIRVRLDGGTRPFSLENDPPWIETAKRSTLDTRVI